MKSKSTGDSVSAFIFRSWVLILISSPCAWAKLEGQFTLRARDQTPSRVKKDRRKVPSDWNCSIEGRSKFFEHLPSHSGAVEKTQVGKTETQTIPSQEFDSKGELKTLSYKRDLSKMFDAEVTFVETCTSPVVYEKCTLESKTDANGDVVLVEQCSIVSGHQVAELAWKCNYNWGPNFPQEEVHQTCFPGATTLVNPSNLGTKIISQSNVNASQMMDEYVRRRLFGTSIRMDSARQSFDKKLCEGNPGAGAVTVHFEQGLDFLWGERPKFEFDITLDGKTTFTLASETGSLNHDVLYCTTLPAVSVRISARQMGRLAVGHYRPVGIDAVSLVRTAPGNVGEISFERTNAIAKWFVDKSTIQVSINDGDSDSQLLEQVARQANKINSINRNPKDYTGGISELDALRIWSTEVGPDRDPKKVRAGTLGGGDFGGSGGGGEF